MTRAEGGFISKVLGTAKATKAALQGLSGVFRQLEREHGEMAALLLRLRASSAPDVRHELFIEFRREILAHERAEGREVYSVLSEHPQTRAVAQAHALDADRMLGAMAELAAVAPDSSEWQPTLELLIERVRQNVHEEESQYLLVGQRVFATRAHELLERYERAKAEALREL